MPRLLTLRSTTLKTLTPEFNWARLLFLLEMDKRVHLHGGSDRSISGLDVGYLVDAVEVGICFPSEGVRERRA
jgi:hypothetical protein